MDVAHNKDIFPWSYKTVLVWNLKKKKQTSKYIEKKLKNSSEDRDDDVEGIRMHCLSEAYLFENLCSITAVLKLFLLCGTLFFAVSPPVTLMYELTTLWETQSKCTVTYLQACNRNVVMFMVWHVSELSLIDACYCQFRFLKLIMFLTSIKKQET